MWAALRAQLPGLIGGGFLGWGIGRGMDGVVDYRAQQRREAIEQARQDQLDRMEQELRELRAAQAQAEERANKWWWQ